MFESFNDFMNQDKFENLKNESYILILGELKGDKVKSFKVFVPDRKTLTELLSLLKGENYVVITVEAFNCKFAKDLIKKLRDEDKPDGLEFG